MALALVLLGSLGIRLLLWLHRGGPLWFEEAVPVVWAQRLWGFERGRIDLNPHSALWPHLSAYVFFVVQVLHYGFGLATGRYHGLDDFRAAAFLDPDLLLGSAMVAEIAIGLCAIVAAARLATRLAGAWMGLAVALVLALEPLHLRYSLVPGPDMLLTLFVTLGLLEALNVLERGRPRDSTLAGTFTGLGIAAKYSPALLLLPLALAHAWSPGPSRGRRFALCAAVAIGVFAATSPFSWLDLLSRGGELAVTLSVFVRGSFGASARPAAFTYLQRVLPGDQGWPLVLLVAAGAAGSLVRRSRERLVLLSYLVPFALLLGVVTSAFERYLLPIVPVALTLAASGLRDAWALPSLRRWVSVAAVASFAGLGFNCVRYFREAYRRDSRAAAREWIDSSLARGSLVALEALGPRLLGVDEQMSLAALPGLSLGVRAALERAPAFSIAQVPMTVHDPEPTAAFYDLRDLAGFDAVVVSGSVRQRYLAEPARFAVQADFYAGLERFWRLDFRTPRDGGSGPEVVVYRSDSARAAGLDAWWAERSARRAAPARRPPDELLATVFARRALCLTRAGRFEPSLRLWPRALLWNQAPGEWWYAEGLSLAGTGHGLGAYRAFREAHRRDPRLTDAGLLAAELALLNGAIDEGRQALEEVLARSALDPPQHRRADSLAREIAGRRPTRSGAYR